MYAILNYTVITDQRSDLGKSSLKFFLKYDNDTCINKYCDYSEQYYGQIMTMNGVVNENGEIQFVLVTCNSVKN